MTVFRGSFQWILQRRLYADDYLIIAGLATLTALSVVITAMLPQFYLAGEPLPLPLDEFVARSTAALKLMFSQMLLFWTTLWAELTCSDSAGCNAPDDLVRADASIRFATGADIAADLLIMILPLNLLRKLTISRSHKLGLTVLFSLGGVIVAFAIARLVQVTKATSDAAKDPTTVANGPVLLSMWSHIESSVSVIVATLPAFRFLLSKNRNMARKTTNKYAGPMIGGPGGMSLRSMRRQKGAIRFGGRDSAMTVSAQGSETELRPFRGLEKKVVFEIEHLPQELSLGETKRRTQEPFA
ncbi:uncharacterized protein LY79DRAFT_586820 [Colletotrichum navitas]|uniref:Rhodopsin domain-containing protein n=1 Tax=Colletotrichum navitas TaxID=681940 RepID=A0AAD8QC37_9PEZI|nr:uncharacterized protein LY79DRAFT_586820 [Colletotrichum navitas]KAK1598199.1 hypothetical protein LY79DRAFT_586820 [Colletotrichum navitas]